MYVYIYDRYWTIEILNTGRTATVYALYDLLLYDLEYIPSLDDK